MKRRFRPTVGAVVSGKKGSTDGAETSNDSTSTQPTRRARIKPKICISSSATHTSTGRIANTCQPSITPRTIRSINSKNSDNQPSANNGSGITPPNADGGDGTSMVTVTAMVHSEPEPDNQLTNNSQCSGVNNQPLTVNTSTSISGENQNDKQTAFAGENQVILTETVHSKSPSKTSDGTLLVSENNGRKSSNVGSKDTVSVDGQLSTGQSTTDSSSPASTLTSPNDGGSQSSISNNEDIVVNVTNQSSAVNMTSTSQVNTSNGDGGQLSTGCVVTASGTPAAPVTSQLSTTINVTLVHKSSDSQPSNESCLNGGDKTTVNQCTATAGQVSQTPSDATVNTASTRQQVRRARIRPKVRIATSKTPVEKALPSKQNLPTPQSLVEKRAANVSKQTSGNSLEQRENTATIDSGERSSTRRESLRSGDKESEETNTRSSCEITSSQDKADSFDVEGSANPPSTSTSGCVESTSKQAPSQLTKRSRIKPRVGIVDRPSVQSAKSRSKPSDKPSLVTTTVVTEKDPGQRLANEQTKSVSEETRNVERNEASSSGRDVVNKLSESRIRNEQGSSEPSGVEDTGTIDGNERLNDNEKRLGHEMTSQVAGNAAEENISSTSEELGAKERPGVVVMDDTSSSVEQTSHILDPKDLSGSLQDDLISPQSDNESVSRFHGSSASPSCLPVMMEDSSILLRPNVTSVGLPSGLGAADTQELLYNVETADDLLQSLLNAENVSSGHVPVRNSRIPQNTSGVGTTGNATTQNVHGDPNTSMVPPSPCVRQGKDATAEISMQNNHAKSVNQTRTEAPTSSNETVTTSRLVTKRQRVRPKSRRSQLLQTQILDISSIPIASNIEIEQEISSSGRGGIDHPVLELPVDLQEDSTQSLSKASKTSGEWGERFQQRRSRTSKVVLSRKRPESSGVHKGIGSGTAGDKTGTSRGTNSSSDSATIAGRSQSSGSQGLSTSDPQDSTGIINEITAIVVDPKNSAAVETENSLSHTNVQDLSTNDRVEIVLEVTGTAQGFANVVCESVHATNELNLNNDEEKQSNGDCRGGESVSERSNACNIDSSTDTSSSLGNLKSKSKRIRRQRASTPLHDVPPFGISLTSDATLSQSQSDTTVASTGTDQLPSNSSSSNMQDLSLNIPESAIEEVILNTNELLPGMGECPECPDLMFCLTAGEDTVVSEGTQDLSQTQPGTLEDNVANATRRTSAEFEEGDSLNDAGRKKTQTTRSVNESAGNDQTIVSGLRGENDTGNGKGCRENRNGRELSQGKEKTDNETTGGNRAASDIELTTSETVSGRQSEEKRGRTVRSKQRPRPNILRKRKAREKILDSDESLDTTGDNGGSGPQDTGVQDGSIGDTSLGDLSAPDASLGVTGVQSDTTQGNAGSEALLEGSTPEAPSDPVQDGAKAKLGSRKRQGKAIKPKIPAKRGRKKAVVQETTEAQDESGLGMNIEASEADENSMLGTGAVQDTEETSQKKKRGRAKSSKKVPEAENETEASSVPKTPKRRKKNQSGNASGQQDTAVNIASMKISDMISYNPMTNPMTSDNENDNQTQFLGGLGSQATAETVLPTNENQPDESAGGEERTDVCAPRVTIDADGNIVLDEESLFIASTPVADNLNKEVVVENANQQYNAIHKRKNSERWGKEETLYFYEVLSQIGTDFSLMAKLFPKRNRTALKKKFKREERTNRDLIDKALNQRIPLAASLFEECLEETEEEMERALIVQSTAEAAAQA